MDHPAGTRPPRQPTRLGDRELGADGLRLARPRRGSSTLPPRIHEATAATSSTGREVERRVDPVGERVRDERREEAVAGQVGGRRVRAGVASTRGQQRADRVVAEERGEQAPDRRQVRDARRGGRRHAVREQAVKSAAGQRREGR